MAGNVRGGIHLGITATAEGVQAALAINRALRERELEPGRTHDRGIELALGLPVRKRPEPDGSRDRGIHLAPVPNGADGGAVEKRLPGGGIAIVLERSCPALEHLSS